jgi:glycine/D-amino acid oxidase-like deaminating enzyme
VKTYPFWWDTVSQSATTPADITQAQLPSRRFDVAIVGAGYTGLSAARRLAKSGASVLVLERGGHAGAGASSMNGGQVLTGLKVDVATLVARYGEPRARALFNLSLDAIAALEQVVADEHIECEWVRSGHVMAASKPSHFVAFQQEQALMARVFDHRVQIVAPADQHTEVGSDGYHGLLVDERSGAINPARYVHGLADAARRHGATLVYATAVEGVQRRGAGWTLTTQLGEVDAGDVLFATNAYTDRAFPGLQRRLVPVGSYIIATAPLTEAQASSILPRRRMAFDSKNFLHYFRLAGDRRLLFGGRAEFVEPTPATTARAARILRRDMIAVFPELAGQPIDYVWGGRVALTRDQMPHAGMLDGMYYAAGYSGHGIAMATSLGDAVARRLAGDHEPHPLMSEAFRTIPLYRGTPWFLPLVGAYYRMVDWLA